MSRYFARTAIASTLAIGTLFAVMPAAPASAALFDVCKDVRITVKNMTGTSVQLFDIDYIDMGTGRKRSENISNRILVDGDSYTFTRNLEGVNNAETILRIQVRKLKANKKWDLSQWWNYDSPKVMCRKGKRFTINLG